MAALARRPAPRDLACPPANYRAGYVGTSQEATGSSLRAGYNYPMRPVLIHAADLELVVDLVNEFAEQPRSEAGEEQDAYPDLRRLRGAASVPKGVLSRVRRPDVVTLANRLYDVFASAGADSARAVDQLNHLLAETAAVPHLSHDGARIQPDWRLPVDSTRPELFLQAACALALHDHAVETGSLDRLATCSGARCVDVYVDATQAATRRFCSSTCGNRAKIKAHRDRLRERARAPGQR